MAKRGEQLQIEECEEGEEDVVGSSACTCDAGESEGKHNNGSTLRSRRRSTLVDNLEDSPEIEVLEREENNSMFMTARFQVPDASSSSSLGNVEVEEDDGDDTTNSMNYTTIRLNKVCEAACVDILLDWESSFTNNNVESKSLPLSLKTTSATMNGGGEHETELMDTVLWKHAGRLHSSLNGFPKQRLIYYAQLVKDILEVLLFAIILLSVAYIVWIFSKFWYMRTTRNSQDAIYPVLRTMRFTSLAFLLNYPNAQELYEEACILQNPFYEMNDVSCWPCENVRHMLDFTGFSNFTSGYYQSGIPFIVKDAQTKDVPFGDVYTLLKEDPTSNLTTTAHLISSHPGVETFEQFFEWTKRKKMDNLSKGGLHVAWKVNRAQYARMMRTLFQRPYYIPQETEISVQHFLFIDEPDGESYPLPITEFANVFLMQGDGPRLVVLMPVRHCQNVCKPIRVLLEPRDVLYYNWLFWRPYISPLKTTGLTNHSLSITYMGSFY